MGLSNSDKKTFEEKGILRLKNLVSKKSADEVKNFIATDIAQLRLQGKKKNALSKLRSLPAFQQIGTLSQMVKIGSHLDSLFSTELVQLMNSLAQSQLKPAAPHPQLLLSLPQKEKWSIKNLRWHLDLAVPDKDEVAGVQAFVLIDDVQTKGGATLAIAGSHKLHYVNTPQGNAHSVLRKDKIFSGLFTTDNVDEDNLLKTHLVCGIEVSITEMSGKAGDIFLMDTRLLHSPSINATKNIRMMATNRFIRY